MGWCFAIVNNKIAEIFFQRKRGKLYLEAHCYVKESEYKTKREKLWIAKDSKKYKFTYRNGVYKDKTTSTIYPQSKAWLNTS